MSDEPEQKIETIYKWINRILAPAMAILLAISGFVMNEVWQSVKSMEERITKIELLQAATTASKFTSNDWSNAKSILDQDRAMIDRRVTRLEESVISIKESLNRIEKKLDTL